MQTRVKVERTITIVQAKDNGGLNQTGNSRDGGKCSTYMPKIKPRRFAEELDVGIREQSRMTMKFLASASEKMRIAIYEVGRAIS